MTPDLIIGNLAYRMVPLGSSLEASTRGTGSGDTFVANPEGWRQTAVIGEVVIFVTPKGQLPA